MIGHRSRVRTTVLLLAAALLFLPSGVSAQGSGEGFLFKQPTVQVGLNGGYSFAHAGGPVLDFAQSELTLGKRDFDAASFGFALAVRASEHLDIAFDVRYSGSDAGSQMRDWEDQDGLAIVQTTSFKRVPLAINAKFYLQGQGRAVSQFAWIPQRLAPFLGAGGGTTWYEFEQKGDFVDFESLDILSLTLKSSGWTPTAHAFAGVDVSITPKFLWTLEGRYSFGSADTGAAFAFESIDLSGFQVTMGLSARF